MKPDFALSLSSDGIELLHRSGAAWVVLGYVSISDPNLPAALAALRDTADAAGAKHGQVKLIIPNDQIKYMSIPDDGLQGHQLESQVRQALTGVTPYAVDDLVYDWSAADGTVQIAAVARETLTEAELFTAGHSFTPVCHVAVAPPDQGLSDEVFFGPVSGWSGPKPTRDDTPVVVVDPQDIPPAALEDAPQTDSAPALATLAAEADVRPAEAADASEDTPTDMAQTEGGAETEDQPVVALVQDVPDQPQTPGADSPDSSSTEDAPAESADVPDARPAASQPTMERAVAAIKSSARSTPPVTHETPAFASVRGAGDAQGAAVDQAEAVPTQFRNKPRAAPPTAPAITAPVIPDPEQAQEAPRRRGTFGFFSRRSGPQRGAEPPAVSQTPVSAPAPTPPPAPAARSAPAAVRADVPPPAARAAAPVPPKPVVTSALQAQRQGTAQPDTGKSRALTQQEQERERMTVFGARKPPKVGGKPRFLGLMLTTGLLVFLAAVAAWAAVTLEDGLASLFTRRNADVTETQPLTPPPAVADLGTAPQEPETPAAPEETIELASLTVSDDAPEFLDDGEPDALSVPNVPRVQSPEEAAATYAATGIWPVPPQSPRVPQVGRVDDVYAAQIDPVIPTVDAAALSPVARLNSDVTPVAQPVPFAPGLRFDLDERGLVRATPQGAISPQGVQVFSGAPPLVAPLRPAAAAAALALLPEAVALQARLRAVAPRARPDGLITSFERTRFQGRTLAELGAIRPMPRAQTEKEVAEADTDATDLAIRRSPVPLTRPRNFEQLVATARANPDNAVVTQVAAAVAPRSVTPDIPSTANVARQATTPNAINLNRLNLIGVYGKPSSRRALVRLPTGRYRKVEVGDRLDGGRVAAIGESELRLTKGSRNVTLKLP